jgi:hypothetical protein
MSASPDIADNVPVEPAPSLRGVLDDLRYEAIEEFLSLLASHARSGQEAAFRGDQRLLNFHLTQSRHVFNAAAQTYKMLGASEARE